MIGEIVVRHPKEIDGKHQVVFIAELGPNFIDIATCSNMVKMLTDVLSDITVRAKIVQ